MSILRILSCIALVSVVAVASAQQCTWEIEPNDTPANATLITGAGPDSALPPGQGRLPTACLAGEMSDNDQDAFIWEVDEQGADQHWVIDLQGIPGQLTRLDLMRVTFADNQVDVTAREDLLTLGTPTGRMVTSVGFLLEPGRYLIGTSISGGAGEYVAYLRPTAALSYRSREARLDRAWDSEFSITGAAPEGLSQAWNVSEDDAEYAWSVTLEAALGTSPELVVSGPGGVVGRVRTDAHGHAQLSNLGLAAGEYVVSIEGATGVYRLSTSREGRKSDGFALEPNNDFATATRFDPGAQMRGTLSRSDNFRVTVDEAAAATAWTLDLEADAALTLVLYSEDGTELLRRRNTTRGLDSLVLRPGVYQLRLEGQDGTNYTLALRSTAVPASGWEVEPNDAPLMATPLGEDGQVRGELGPDDVDVFALEVSGEAQLYRLQLISKGSVDLAVLDGGGREYTSTRGEQRLRLDNLLLLTGTHHIRVSRGEGEYALRVLPLGPAPAQAAPADLPDPDTPLTAAPVVEEQTPAEAAENPATAALPPLPPPPPGQLELEPNGDRTRANLLTPGVPRVGTLPSDTDADYYRFHLANDQPVRVELVPPAGGQPIPFRLIATGWVEPDRNAEPGTPTVTEQWLRAGDHYLEVRAATTGNGYYQLRLTQLNAALPWGEAEAEEERMNAGVSVTLTSPATDLAAYWGQGQSVTATARISNDTPQAQDVDLAAATTDARVGLELPARLHLEPGASAEVPVMVTVPADLRDDLPLRISLAATTAAGSSGASLAFAARCEAPPVNPAPHWPVPEPLLGGIDLLWSGLGATVHGDTGKEARDRALIDGRVTPSYGGWISVDEPATYQLAGEAPAELVGALLHPLAQANVDDQLKRFRIETSLDGVSFTTVHEGELLAARIEQAVVFERPVLARYARIVGLGDQRERRGGYVGEFKLIAREPAPLGSFDLADPALGGHVVWSEPHTGNSFLWPDERPAMVDLRTLDAFTFVVGFHNGRAAQITRLEWADSAEAVAAGTAFPATTVEVSLTGAAGPWQPLAEWELTRDASGRTTLELPEPVWARYLRFTAAKANAEQRNWAVPIDLVVEERRADGDYASALGEWGLGSPLGVYEYLQPPAVPATTESDADNDTMQSATRLASGAAVEGTVLVGEDVDWYRLTIEPGHNHLEVRLSGEPTIAYDYALVDANGAPVAYDLSTSGDAVVLSLYGEPGDYFLKLEEPKRTVVFSWDTSGSMGPFLEITYNALATFAAGVDSARESVQLLAYDSPLPKWLLPIWTGDTQRVQRTVNEFDREPDSSNSEPAVLMATRALEGRDGTRALLLITDAETGSYGLTTEVWRALEQVRPRIFTFEVSSGGSLFSQQLMQDWAAVNEGYYALAATIGDLDAGYNRASCILRRPKHYRVEVTSSAAALPGPGSLRVTRPADAPEAAVEVIFDASGSMGVPLPSGEQRITAAKRVLESLVSEVLPEGSAFALRAFGHVEPMTCNTRLELPLAPLDRAEALAAVRAIEPKLLSQTPLAESLAAVGDDLARAGRSRTVILITDGEESCGADPVEAVRALRQNHPVDLVIVSLGLGAEEKASFEALAAATNASYVDVTSFEELKASVDGALNKRFEVVDEAGEVVATGLVDGEAVELPMGVYTVRVFGAPMQEIANVRVPGESSVTVTYGGW